MSIKILIFISGILIGFIIFEVINKIFYNRVRKNVHKVLVSINFTNRDQLNFELDTENNQEVSKIPEILCKLLDWYNYKDTLDYSLILDDYVTKLSKDKILDIHFKVC